MEKVADSRPPNDAWVAAIHPSEHDEKSLGSGFAIDSLRVVTCAHVIRDQLARQGELWVAFPKSEDPNAVRIRVSHVSPLPAASHSHQDVAILTLSMAIPVTQTPRLRCPTPADAVGKNWWAFGFPSGDVLGNSASGTVGESLGYGWIRLDVHSRYTVKKGFSGSALWSPDYEAIIGMIGQASGDRGDARAISLWQIDRIYPEAEIQGLARWSAADADETALSSWGWSLHEDPEAGRHWRPRSRGVSIETEQGFRFRGRSAALSKIVDWLKGPTKRKALVVTGSPGVGKSAVLGRIVTTSDKEISDSLPTDDTAVRAGTGSIACAVHAKGKTALDVAIEITKAASAALPEDIDYLPENLRLALLNRRHGDFNIIIDALDEAATSQQSRLIIRRVLTPLVETCADLGIRVVVGCRRSDAEGDLIGEFGRAFELLDLDDADYFEQGDLVAYALATLQLLGDERPESPYRDHAVALPVASKIASMAEHNFLVAGLVARSHGLHDTVAVDPQNIAFTPTVDGALHEYLSRIPAIGSCSANIILTALSFAEAPGFSIPLWRIAIESVSNIALTEDQLFQFARSSAANFLVETNGSDRNTVYRLFHQALNDTLLASRSKFRSPESDQQLLARAMIAEGRRKSWKRSDLYLHRSLIAHAELGHVLEEILSDDEYFLYADLRRAVPVIDRDKSDLARTRAKLIRRTRRAFYASPSERLALFSVTEAQQRLGRSYQSLHGSAPYRALWSDVVPGAEEAVMEGHTRWSYIICSFTSDEITVLASAGGDRTVRIWDPVLCEVLHVLEGHTDEVRALAPVTVGGRRSLASAGRDGNIFLWDVTTGEQVGVIPGSPPGFSAMRSTTWNDRSYLIVASVAYNQVLLIDPADGTVAAELQQHDDWIADVCDADASGLRLIVSCSEDGAVIVWDLDRSQVHLQLQVDHGEWVRSLCTIEVAERTLIAGGCSDTTVRLWDPVTGEQVALLTGHGGEVFSVCSAQMNGEPVLVSTGSDATIRLWDPNRGIPLKTLRGHSDWVYSICSLQSGTRQKLASTGDDRSIRLWEPETGSEMTLAEDAQVETFEISCSLTTNYGPIAATAEVGGDTVAFREPGTGKRLGSINSESVHTMCAVSVDGKPRIALAGESLEIWDPVDRVRTRAWKLTGEYKRSNISSICTLKVFDTVLMATALNREILFWDLSRSSPVHRIALKTSVREICPVILPQRRLLSALGFDGKAYLIDPQNGTEVSRLEDDRSSLVVQCFTRISGQAVVVTGSDNGVIHLWDPETGKSRGKLEGPATRLLNLWVTETCGQNLLVSLGSDRSLRVWDPMRGTCLVDIPVYYPVVWAFPSNEAILLSLSVGMMGIRLESVRGKGSDLLDQ